MSIIIRHIKVIMLVSGALTCTMLVAAVAPATALHSTFGETLNGPLAELVVRNWGILITMVGVMLISGGVNPEHRRVSLLMATVSKLAFIALVLSNGTRYLAHGAGTAVLVDSAMVAVFVVYLAATRKQATARQARS
jgi:hypothetical protein